ncbi:MAG: cytochrome c3 family protein [Thermodesulfobacteriota bacterium]
MRNAEYNKKNSNDCSVKGHIAARVLVYALGIVIFAGLSLTLKPAFATVAATKHNFGIFSGAAIKTGSTTRVCVFCHAPHNTSPSGPMWNREDSGATYNIYQSETIVATMGQPTGSSKLCLSCHDGTIAIGSLKNVTGVVGPYTLPVTGPGVAGAGPDAGKLTSVSTAFIGTDLRDDHPLSFDYALSYPANLEIKADTALPAAVKLDKNNMVQCTSCHDPHGTIYPAFMVTSLENGVLCEACHTKRYWGAGSAHRDSLAVWNQTGENPYHLDMGAAGFADDTPQMQSCLACHRSHGGVAAKSLLKGTDPVSSTMVAEEWTCLNCHNGNVAGKDINALFAKISKHDVKGVSGAHIPSRDPVAPGDPARETAANINFTRHAECSDCHNPHGVQAGNHAVGGINGNVIGPNLLGSWGVMPTIWPLSGPAFSYQVVDFTSTLPGGDNLEGYLCIKCHSYYAYSTIPPNVPSGDPNSGGIVRQSDPTDDFNINNKGFHPVFGQGKNRPPIGANPNWPKNLDGSPNGLGLTNTFSYVEPTSLPRTGFYNFKHDSTMTCTDCHGPDRTSLLGPLDPQGPHGSNNKWILRSNETGVGTLGNFCYNCHRRDVYGDEGFVGPQANFSRVPHPVDGLGTASPFYTLGAGTGNDSNYFGNLCLTCHGGGFDTLNTMMKGIHGSNAPAGVVAGSSPLGYRLMNGACMESYVPATPFAGAQLYFRTVDTALDKVCKHNFADILTGVTATYSCNTVADCSN